MGGQRIRSLLVLVEVYLGLELWLVRHASVFPESGEGVGRWR